MGRNFSYRKQLLLLLCGMIGAVFLYAPARKPALLSTLELTNSITYTDEQGTYPLRSPDMQKSTLADPNKGPGGPILVITSPENRFATYAAEILRAEGLNEFHTADLTDVTAELLAKHDVVLLGRIALSAEQVGALTTWVNEGGVLVAFRPHENLLPLFGLIPTGETIADKYLLAHCDAGPGAGIVEQVIQFHDTADLHQLDGATSQAILFMDDTTATTSPAVSTISRGSNGGKAISFSYDLPKSIIFTRQGNPKWARQKRDGMGHPIRSNDLFFGGVDRDWIDMGRIAIPQADEQQRFLVNIILQNNMHNKPLPRFWYLPRDLKAVIVMTGDDHGNNGTAGRFKQYLKFGNNSAADILNWKAIRATSYIYPSTPITEKEVLAFQKLGFEIALHPNTDCNDYANGSLRETFNEQLNRFAARFPGVAKPVTNRTHCLVWSDWASTPKLEQEMGMRLDANYYYWPEEWTRNNPGFFTGSGMPMRFADANGAMIDTYQLPTQMTDETNMDYTSFCNALLDKAIGPEGYYGVFCANMHTDMIHHPGSSAIINSARERGVPVISARQMLTWLDGRNNSNFQNIRWVDNKLNFTVSAHRYAYNLRVMLPVFSKTGQLISINRDNEAVDFSTQMIKGMEYAFFGVPAGVHNFSVTYNHSLDEGLAPMALNVHDFDHNRP